ncbi:MAG: hypothetical protein ABJN52_14710 [Litorimonas sp.]
MAETKGQDMNMPFWRNWIFLWALMPVFAAFFQMASHRLHNDFFNVTVAIETHHTWGITFVFFASAILFLIAPFFVLKRHVLSYDVSSHALVLLGAWIGLSIIFIFEFATKSFPAEGFFRFEREFSLAVLRAKRDAPVLFGDIVSLPWGKLMVQKMVTASVVFAGPVLVICFVARRVNSFPRAMLFVGLTAAAIAISDAFFDISRSRVTGLNVLNGRAWSERLAIIASWSVSSVIGASISAIGIGALLERHDTDRRRKQSSEWQIFATGVRLAGITATVLWSVFFSVQYVVRPNGLASDFAEFRKSLTSPPETDVSVGDSILTFSHILGANTYRYPNSNYVNFELSPDGRSAVVLEAYGKNGSQLAAFGIESSDRLVTLSGPLLQHERVSFIWTKDQQHLLVRSRGEPIEVGRYTRYQTKLTLFSLPEYEQVAQWQPTDISCQNPETPRISLAEDDSGNLVVLCLAPSAEDDSHPLAVQLSLPSLDEIGSQILESHMADSRADRLIEVGGAVYAPMIQWRGEPRVVLENVIRSELSVVLDDPYAADRGGELTFQGFVIDGVPDGMIGMRFCGGIETVSNPPRVSTEAAWGPSFCRVARFGLSDGYYVGYTDDVETRVSHDNSRPRDFSIPFKEWEITGVVDRLSLTGSIKVSDVDSGAVIQTIESSTQTPVTASEELGLLFTYRVDARQIAVYDIAQ